MPTPQELYRRRFAEFEGGPVGQALNLTEEQMEAVTPTSIRFMQGRLAEAEKMRQKRFVDLYGKVSDVGTIPVRRSRVFPGEGPEGAQDVIYLTPSQAIDLSKGRPEKVRLYESYLANLERYGVAEEDKLPFDAFLASDATSAKEYTVYRHLARQRGVKKILPFEDFTKQIGRSRAGIAEKVKTAEEVTKVTGEVKQELGVKERILKGGYLLDVEKDVRELPDFREGLANARADAVAEIEAGTSARKKKTEEFKKQRRELVKKADEQYIKNRVNRKLKDDIEAGIGTVVKSYEPAVKDGQRGWNVYFLDGTSKFQRAK